MKETTRCFIAIPVKSQVDYSMFLNSNKVDYKIKLKIIDPKQYHLTLHFFGELLNDEIKIINERLNDLEFNSFKIKFSQTGSFPRYKLNKTRVLIIKIEDKVMAINSLASLIKKSIRELGIPIDDRKFKPHLTTARIRGGEEIKKFTTIWLEQDFEPFAIAIDQFVLFKTANEGRGVQYTPLFDYKLN